MARSIVKKDNFNKFQKDFTIRVTKRLEKLGQQLEVDVSDKVATKLEQCYKDNVKQSYGPRSVGAAQDILFNEKAKKAEQEDRKQGLNIRHKRRRIPYIHTGTFEESIYVAKDGRKLSVMIRDVPYEDSDRSYDESTRSTVDVYEWLTHGTDGSDKPYWFKSRSGNRPYASNYPTPRHEFEEQTMVQMIGYLDSLKNDLERGKYPN